MTDALLLVALVLAAYRVWRFVALDDLPGITRLRDALEDRVATAHGAEWASGIRCHWCSGWWASCAVVGTTWALRPLPLPGLWFLATATGVAALAVALED